MNQSQQKNLEIDPIFGAVAAAAEEHTPQDKNWARSQYPEIWTLSWPEYLPSAG